MFQRFRYQPTQPLPVKKLSRTFEQRNARAQSPDAGRFSAELALTGEPEPPLLSGTGDPAQQVRNRLSKEGSQMNASREVAASGGAAVRAEQSAEAFGSLDRHVGVPGTLASGGRSSGTISSLPRRGHSTASEASEKLDYVTVSNEGAGKPYSVNKLVLHKNP